VRSLNAIAVAPSVAGWLSLFTGGSEPPLTSTLNFAAGQIRANNLTLKLDESGAGTLGAQAMLSSGSVHLVVDVNGYYQ
jgi:hypothetical protein